MRGEGDLDVLDGLVPEHVMAYGESQSAMRLVSYVNGVHPLAHAYDGFFIHSRGGSGVLFTPEKLMELYATHDAYVIGVTEAALAAREAGFILEPEARAMIDEAQNAPIPK